MERLKTWEIANENFRVNENGEIQLCTGIKDRDGKLIYEGDILKDTRTCGYARIKIIYKNGDFFYDFISAKIAFTPFKFSKNSGLFTTDEISKIFKIDESL